MRAAADADHIRVAKDDVDGFDRQHQQIGSDLGKAGFVALAARLRADDDADAALRLDRDLGALARRADRGLDVIGQPETEQPAALLCLAPALLAGAAT